MPASDDSLSETIACDLLAKLFRKRGYAIARNIPFREYGVSFHIDGWDAKARVGFEFLTSEDDDHDDLTLEEYKTLMDAQHRGELTLFIIDEVEALSSADLSYTVNEFLDEVAAVAKDTRSGRGAKRSVKKTVQKMAKKSAKRALSPAAAAKSIVKSAKQKPRVKPTAAKLVNKPTGKRAAQKPAKKPVKKPVKKRAG